MDVCVLFSGGKDSTYAACLAKKEGHNIKYLLSFYSKNPESYMFHSANIKLTELQAQLMRIKHIAVETEGKKEEELKDIKNALEPLDIDAVVSGAQASRYQKSRIDILCRELGLKSIAPLWGKNPVQLLRDENMYGFKTIITSISAEGLERIVARKGNQRGMHFRFGKAE